MPRLLARTLITILMAPVALVVYVASVALVEHGTRVLLRGMSWSDREWWSWLAVLAILLIEGLVALLIQWLIWRGVVSWTPKRRSRTRWVWLGLLAVCALQGCGWVLTGLDLDFIAPASIVCTVFLTLIALILNFAFWTETPTERAKRMARGGLNRTACPICRYDLAGLTNLRCPECGSEFTFGAIVDENRRREVPSALDG